MASHDRGAPLSIWVTGAPVPAARRLAGTFPDMIRAAVGDAWNGGWSDVDAVDERSPLPEPDDVAGVIVTGSPARIAEQRPWMRRAQDALLAHVERGVPVLGICFGHQLLGAALGGASGANPRGREIGTVELATFAENDLIPAYSCFPVSMTHLDVVLELPPGAEPVAATALDGYAAIRFGERAWGVQFHPEMGAEIMRAYVLALRDALAEEGIDADLVHAACRDTPDAARILLSFVQHVARFRPASAPVAGRRIDAPAQPKY